MPRAPPELSTSGDAEPANWIVKAVLAKDKLDVATFEGLPAQQGDVFMSEAKTASPAGKFVWCEWMGDDVKAAADFYAHVVGWNAKDSAIAGARPYTSFRPMNAASPA